ncbi:MAG: lmo0937 family membrane protein [Bacteroidia bacterium]|nr:lmo0937 family membrane protein [Bacteroidia bacterium]
MGNLLYIVAVVLIVLWALGLGYHTGGNLIHILLVIAIIAILLRVIQGKKPI